MVTCIEPYSTYEALRRFTENKSNYIKHANTVELEANRVF